jgi:hypothetical protein
LINNKLCKNWGIAEAPTNKRATDAEDMRNGHAFGQKWHYKELKVGLSCEDMVAWMGIM